MKKETRLKADYILSQLLNGLTLEQINLPKPVTVKKYHNSEKDVVNKLLINAQVSYQKEVKTPLGKIDILTEKHLIEVKKYKNFHHCLGQLLTYSRYYPDKLLIGVLFGKGLRLAVVREIEALFTNYNIIAEFIYDIPTYMKISNKYFKH